MTIWQFRYADDGEMIECRTNDEGSWRQAIGKDFTNCVGEPTCWIEANVVKHIQREAARHKAKVQRHHALWSAIEMYFDTSGQQEQLEALKRAVDWVEKEHD